MCRLWLLHNLRVHAAATAADTVDAAHWGAPQSWRAFRSSRIRAQTSLISADRINHQNKCERLSPSIRQVSSAFVKPDSQAGFINCTARLGTVYWFLWQHHPCSSSPRPDSHRSSAPGQRRWAVAEKHLDFHIFKVALQPFERLPESLAE